MTPLPSAASHGDTVTLDLELDCIVGILPRERVTPQPLRISLRLDLDLGPVGESGDLRRGVDYATIDRQVRFLAGEGRFRLIESLGIAILRVVLTPPVARARVRLAKPTILPGSLPAIELSRDLAWAVPGPIARLPEVDADWRVLAAGETLAEGAALAPDGPVAVPFRAVSPCVLLVLRAR